MRRADYRSAFSMIASMPADIGSAIITSRCGDVHETYDFNQATISP
jgi:hypothetical protein